MKIELQIILESISSISFTRYVLVCLYRLSNPSMHYFVKIFLLCVTVCCANISDYDHMQSCVTCVRLSMASTEPVVDRLLRQANHELDTVILYLLRTCYFTLHRSASEYDLHILLASASRHVAGFTDYEFGLLHNITTQEAFSKIEQKRANDDSYPVSNDQLYMVCLALISIAALSWLFRTKTYSKVS